VSRLSENMEDIVSQLRDVGMSGYEAKAYVALLQFGRPVNGYEVAKRSGVPRSTVYETLAKLVARGAAFEVRDGTSSGGTSYLALPAESLLARLRREFDSHLSALSISLPDVVAPIEASLVYNIRGRANVLERARGLIDSASEDLFISIWPEEAESLLDTMERATKRGAEVFVMSFGKLGRNVGYTYEHRFSAKDVVLERTGARLFVICPDRRSVLIGGAVDGEMWAMSSDDPAVVLVAAEYVRHDIAMQVLVERLGEEAVDSFWHVDPALVRLQHGRGAVGLPQRKADRGRARPS
jgi:sugar-specific transcriptional regulator TrmB